jgi:proteasome lid subunit RPN8/RPN11
VIISSTVALSIQRAAVEEMERHAARTYPLECCGIVIRVDGIDQVRPIRNIQDRLHAENPAEHPRDARIAYFMDPQELYAVLSEAEGSGRPIRLFYHSHPDHGAYFSDEDAARAMAWDEPAYPDAAYLVLSVVGGAVKERVAVAWDARLRKFSPVDLLVD